MDLPRLALVAVIALASGPAGAAPPKQPPLTSAGFGQVRIGMPERDAARLLGLKTPSDDDGVSSYQCRELTWPGHSSVAFMARNGRISRISLYGKSSLKTDRGFTVGSREADIRRAYGPGLKVETHAYDDEPAHYLTFWDPGKKRGVRYETDIHGKVTTVHVGDSAIEYIESCL